MGQDLLAQSGRATPGGRSLQRDKTLHDFRYVLVRDRCVIGIPHLSHDIRHWVAVSLGWWDIIVAE